MENNNKHIDEKNGMSITNILSKDIDNQGIIWQENITLLDLCAQNIKVLDDKLKLPPNLLQLNLSHNQLVGIPTLVLNLEKLETLNISHNSIQYFDDIPACCHTLIQLDISYNQLAGPPYWIWSESPKKLIKINLSNNHNITNSFANGYFEELLLYSTSVKEVYLQNCKIEKFTKLLTTFPEADYICLGAAEYRSNANSIIELPCQGLDECCSLKRLSVSNTQIYTLNPSIDKLVSLVELNLAHNNLNGLPKEFCNLINLETCILSENGLICLPEDIEKMEKLVKLYLDSNALCMLPENLCKLPNLKILDIYDNNLNELPISFDNLVEFDVAQNYFEEPEDTVYLERKEKLRLAHVRRYDGRKDVVCKSEDCYKTNSENEDDEELNNIFLNENKIADLEQNMYPSSSPEDWDSDDYWVPFYQNNSIPMAQSPWIYFVKNKMKEGNFCPMDAHPVSIVDKVRYERTYNPQVTHECDGQFDDYSSDDT